MYCVLCARMLECLHVRNIWLAHAQLTSSLLVDRRFLNIRGFSLEPARFEGSQSMKTSSWECGFKQTSMH